MQRLFVVSIAVVGLALLTQAAVLRTSKTAGAPAAAAAASPAAVPTPRPVGVGDPRAFADLLPFHPAGQPEVMFKNRCTDFLNHVLEKSGNDAAVVEKLMPKCKWSAPECEQLKADLVGRLSVLPKPIASGAPAAAAPASKAAAGLLQIAAVAPGLPMFVQMAAAAIHAAAPAAAGTAAAPSGGRASLYGWCDKMYEMTHQRALSELNNATAPAAAPVAAPVAAQ